MTETATPLDELVVVYLRIRNALQEKEEAHAAEMQPLQAEFELIGDKLLDICNAQNAETIRTAAGTVSRRVSSRYWTNNWPSMYNLIKEFDAPFLLEQRIHNTNMKQFLEENPTAFPPGLQAERKFKVQVRRPTNR